MMEYGYCYNLLYHNCNTQKDMQERVRFFSKEDLSLSYYLRMAEGVVDEYNY